MKRLLALLIIRDTDHFRLWTRALEITCNGSHRLSAYEHVQLWSIDILMAR